VSNRGIGTGGVSSFGGGTHRNWRELDANEIAARLNLSSSHELALDVGDATSYTSGDKWVDLKSGDDFNRGADATTDGTEPTFNGSAGGLSDAEYWSFDGADYFTYDTTIEAWMDDLHKNNAAFGLAFLIYPAAFAGGVQAIWSTSRTGGEIGILLYFGTSGQVILEVDNGSTDVLSVVGATANATAWNFIVLSIDEANATGFMAVNGKVHKFTSTYSSPSASSASYAPLIGERGDTGTPLLSGSRLAQVMAWSRSVPLNEINRLRQGLRPRFLI
jgi:hypothetical protein